MATIWIWNSIASRRRSSSDTFVENGLGVLAGAVEQAGHRVRVIDWARSDFYGTLTPAILARTARTLTLILMRLGRGKPGPGFRVLGVLNLWLQQVMAMFQRRRMAAALRSLARDVAQSGIRIFGMKVWYGEAFSWSRYLAAEIRRLAPEVVLVAGGYHATLYEEDFLRHSPFDLAVISEGEAALNRILRVIDEAGTAGKEAILDLIRTEIAGGQLTNVVYRDGQAVRKTGKLAGDINAKTVSVYGDMTGKVRLHVLLESSGCPWGKCHFCVHHHLEPEYLRRKVEKIVEEIRMMREHGIGLFRFAGSDTPPEFGAAIAQGILESGLRLEYAMGSRAVRGARHPEVYSDLVEKYAAMIRSGLRAVFMGGETGHDLINEKVMNKGLGREDLLWTIRALREAEKRAGRHVDISLAMIYPTPLADGVTLADVMAANLSLIGEARPDSVMVTPPGPFKNSEWFKRQAEFGFELAPGFIETAMSYEYVLYKPPELWPALGLRQGGMDFVALLRACGTMRSAVEELGIPSDLSDEHFLMLRACGYEGAEGARAFKRETLADIVSCDYRRLDELCAIANDRSMKLADHRRPSSARQAVTLRIPKPPPVLSEAFATLESSG